MVDLAIRKEMSVAALENGTVLDHIRAGCALPIIRMLKLAEYGTAVTVGLNLESKRLGKKDLIKIADWELDPAMANQVALLSPDTTVTVIRNYEVVHKFAVDFPSEIEGWLECSNSNCITHFERLTSRFHLQRQGNKVQLLCHYCHSISKR